ncbi:cupin domain-containing protein [Enemella sp. A6]|uniref:cupin domain-containing protein n=1 Tax=Enemella sp. A6 TaxID=3440152 RepID=UPI003EBC16B8
MNENTPVNPKERLRVVRHDEREELWFLGEYTDFIITGAMTEGRLLVYTHDALPNSAPPLHEHIGEDEILILIEGSITFWAADQEHTLYGGDAIVLPKDLPHTFRVGTEGARYMVLTSPANFENFVRDMSVPATFRGPEPGFEFTPEYTQRLNETAAKHGITIMAPPGTLPTDFPGGTEPVR